MAQAATSLLRGIPRRLAKLASLALLAAPAACVVAPAARSPAAPRIIVSTSGSSAVAGNRAYRWSSHAHHPLRVWIEPTSRLKGWTPARLAEADRALRAWEASGVVDLERTARSGDAEIRLYWSDGLPAQHPGITLLHPNAQGELVHADIWVNVSAPARRTATAEQVEYGIIAHEIGHALGLPHADERNEIMYPVLYTLAVTPDDLDELRTIVTGRASRRATATASAVGGGGRQ